MRWRGLLGLVLGGLACGGCTLGPAAPPRGTVSLKLPVSKTGGKRLTPITNLTVQTWLKKAFEPRRNPVAGGKGLPAIYIDTTALAHRHPAWRLADNLEHEVMAAPVVAKPAAQGLPAVPALPAYPLPRPASRQRHLAAETLTVRDGNGVERGEQLEASERFLTAAAERNDQLAKDAERWARQYLEDEVEVARRKAVSEIDPKQLPERVQLDLENLNLDLLPRIRKTATERAATKVKIDAIEAGWQKDLRDQERQQVAKVQYALNEVPKQVRAQGEERIQRLLARIRTERAGSRETIRAEQAALLNKDFSAGNLDLSLPLPSATLAEPALPAKETKNRSQEFSETFAPLSPSVAAPDANRLTVPANGSRAQLIKSLRAEAMREAQGWAQLAALRYGARLAKEPGVQNRTREALSWLPGPEKAAKAVR